MTKSGQFELHDETGMKKTKGYFCSTLHLIVLAIVVVILLIVVGCMAYFLPDRPCKPPTSNGVVGEPTKSTAPEEEWNGRLPRNLIPRIYHIYLKPYLLEEDVGPDTRLFTFDGQVKINMTCDVATDVITLHSKNITILSYELVDDVGNAVTVADVTYEDRYDFVHFHLDMMLEEGRSYELVVDYLGELLEGNTGFYRNSYEERGETKWYAASQMEATHARNALPCFDEPDLKAVFHTQIEHRADMVALTNGIEETEVETQDGWVKTAYRATPVMSNYLLAFVVGYFNYTEQYSDRGVRYRVWSRPEKIEATRYGLDIGVNMTTYFESYFNISFDLPKQDMIATSVGGAMENWGLIIYVESYLLFDSKIDSAEDKQRVTTVVAHELAHQWTGNLVTCAWWNDIWLNEGITTYLSDLGIDSAKPTWRIHEQFPIVYETVFKTDARVTSRPVRPPPVDTPDEISELFEDISYYKGAQITRMLRNMLGEEVFMSGIRHYLNRHKMDVVVTDNLWAAFTEVDKGIGDNDVKKIMDTWTLQMGFPVVDLQRINDHQVNASQERFLVDHDADAEDKYGDLGYLWYIYLTYTQKTDANFEMPLSTWIQKEPWALVELSPSMGNEDWYLANVKQSGFFRVDYDDENWARLGKQLVDDHTVLPVESRAQLINDAFTLAKVGRLDYPLAFDLTLYMVNELDYVPWEAVLGFLSHIRDMFGTYSGYGHLESYMHQQVQTLYTAVGWDDDPETDPHLEQLNRINTIETSCKYSNQDCLDKASALYRQYMEHDANNTENKADYDINPITPNLKKTVYCYGIQEGGQKEWNFGWKKFTEDKTKHSIWLKALSCSKRPWILNRFLYYSLNTTHLAKRDSSVIIKYVSQNAVGRALAWNFVRNEWDDLKEYYGGDELSKNTDLQNMISDVTANFNTPLELQDLLAFGEDRDFGSAKSKYAKAIKKIQTNIAWIENYAKTISQWLEGAVPNDGE
ncbi:aminopeptidase N [Strongylocentrotus purpuratus]|uniref:Aminopeptidase n=1 Tax=Strongylocentrotus purpuratus TaxID=7668 RepID=A0A7M7NXS1_STRPU|nr:aminopeptidase N [Strongylocentrotus purpuratus]